MSKCYEVKMIGISKIDNDLNKIKLYLFSEALTQKLVAKNRQQLGNYEISSGLY